MSLVTITITIIIIDKVILGTLALILLIAGTQINFLTTNVTVIIIVLRATPGASIPLYCRIGTKMSSANSSYSTVG